MYFKKERANKGRERTNTREKGMESKTSQINIVNYVDCSENKFKFKQEIQGLCEEVHREENFT